MIIESSQLQLSGEHQKFELRQESTSVEAFMVEFNAARARQPRGDTPQILPVSLQTALAPDQLTRDQDGFRLQRAESSPLWPDHAPLNGAARLFHALLQALTGRSLPVPGMKGGAEPAENAAPPSQPRTARALKVELQLHQKVEEHEQSHFSAKGQVQTRDGVRLDLDLSLTMSRSYSSETHVTLDETLQFKDPLVVNFDGSAAELSDETYRFDLDADGEQEWISRLTGNRAFLALDRNGDGTINDGTELFGALSGDGFADLAGYDEDGNGWIDGGDSVFTDLRLWQQDSPQQELETLAQREIGALYLGATATPFDLKGEENRTLGQVRQSGIFLTEEGSVGTLQQIDLAV